MSECHLSMKFFNISVVVHTSCEDLAKRLKNDFKAFITENSNEAVNISIESKRVKPDLSKVYGDRKFFRRKILTLDSGQIRNNIYEDKLLSVYDFSKESGKLYCDDIHLLHEITYLLILSRVGKMLDLQGFHRLHAMNVLKDDKSVVACGASGVGKSTQALNFLKKGWSLGSDDLTIVAPSGEMLTFPIRLGFHEKINQLGIEPVELRRREYGKKYLHDLSNCTKKDSVLKNKKIILLKRSNGIKSRISNSTFKDKICYLVKYLVIGIGTPQIFEYFWESGLNDFFLKSKIFVLRLRSAINLLVKYDFVTVEISNGSDLSEILDD